MPGMKKNTTNIILSIIAVILVISFTIVLVLDNKETKINYQKNAQISSQVQVERREKMVELEKREATDSFYQKLADGFDVNILIVGDSIGMGLGVDDESLDWIDLLETKLVETYNVNVNTKNISLADSTSYAGYVRTMALEESDYDLAIICYGQNDDDQYFGVFYEGIIRAIRSQNEKCSIISILESSQKKFTDKMVAIQELSDYYGNLVADTITPFTDKSNGSYDSLTSENGVDPNARGHQIYCNVLTKLIEDEVAKGTPYNDEEVEIVHSWVKNLTNFKGITAREFKKTENKFIYTLDEPLTGVFGIDYKYMIGENGCKIFIDGKEYKAPQATVSSDYLKLYILVIQNKPIAAKNTIEVRFSSEEQAAGFKGICVSWP